MDGVHLPRTLSLTDKTAAFEAVDGGSIPSGCTSKEPRHKRWFFDISTILSSTILPGLRLRYNPPMHWLSHRWRFPLILSLALILFQAGLFTFIQHQAGPTRAWLGDYIWNSSDQAVYFTYIEQAKQGSIWFKSFYTPQEAGTFLHPFYIPVGWIAYLLNLPPLHAHEIAKAIVTMIATFLLWTVARGTTENDRDANIATIIMLAGGGMGWILVVKQAMTGFFPQDFFIPDISTETFFFPTTMGGAHIPLSIALLIYSLYRLWHDLTNKDHVPRPSWQGLMGITLLLFIHPYFVATLGIAGLIIAIKERVFIGNIIRSGLIYSLFVTLALAPHIYTYFANPYRRFLLDGNVLDMPSLTQNFFAFMPWIALIVWRLRRHHFTEKEHWILIWIASVAITLILPFNFKRKLLEGFGLALILLAIPVWTQVIAWAKRTGKIAHVGIWAIAFLSPFSIFQSQLAWVTYTLGKGDEFFVSQHIQQTWEWLKKNTTNKDMILTDTPWLGLWIPPNTSRHVWIAHDYETPDYKQRRALLKELFETQNQERVQSLLKETGSTILVTSSFENGNLLKEKAGNQWKEAATFGELTIWKH